MTGSKITAIDKAQHEHQDPNDPNYNPRHDPDVGPYDPDNDFLPE
jgi:hypothetical protein